MSVDQTSIDNLNSALRLYRRLLFRLVAIFVLGFAGVIALAYLSTALNPPYGVYIFGEGLETWGMIIVLAAILAEIWWEGRQIGHIMNDQVLLTFPYAGLLSGPSVVAQRAKAMGMEWSGFMGPLRPARRK